MKILISILFILVAVAAAFIVWRVVRRHVLSVKQKNYEKIVSQAVKINLKKIKTKNFNGSKIKVNDLIGTPVALVWGMNVVVYGYEVPVSFLEKSEVIDIKQKLAELLNGYADKSHQNGIQGHYPFVVSDMWSRVGKLYIEISFLINEATVEYLHDVRKLENLD